LQRLQACIAVGFGAGGIGLGLLGFLGTLMGLVDYLRSLGGMVLKNPPATESKAIMALLCLIYVALCVRSFIAARKARLV